jgi:hypothetical protein
MAVRDKTAVAARDVELLVWMAEQYAARVDQVACWLGRSERTAWRSAARLEALGWVEAGRLLVGEPAWVWPTGRGLREAGAGFSKAWVPSVGRLSHVAAVNEVRLHVEARSPGSLWVPERVLARERSGPREHLPDGEVHVGGERHAIEVELVPKAKPRVVGVVEELSGRYDRVVYFCSAKARRQLEALAARNDWPRLALRDLPARTTAPGEAAA